MINNEGQLVFDYDLEDTDQVGGANVFNGQESVLWNNIRDAFSEEIANMYVTLRTGGKFNYPTIRDKMADHQSTWPEAIWNVDAYQKWLNPFIADDENYLDMAQGDKKAQRDWWLFNGFRYRDSKYGCGDALNNYITLRLYAPGDIEITPYSHIWPRVKFGSVMMAVRGKKNQTYTFSNPEGSNPNDLETYIYSADRIADIGDLSDLQVGLANFAPATKLQSIILGSSEEGYVNQKLESLALGSNKLLTYLNVENCIALSDPINASECTGLETVKAKGSKLTGITFPNGGHLKWVELPETLANLEILNQKNIQVLDIEGYDNISTIHIENTPNIDLETIINSSPNLSRVRLVKMEWEASNETTLRNTITKLEKCIGIDANGIETSKAVVTGRVYVDSITDAFLEEINDNFPELIVVAGGKAKFFVRYLNYDNTLLYRYIAEEGTAAIDPVALDLIDEPTRPDTETAKYKYQGWKDLPAEVIKPYNIIAKYYSSYRVDFMNENATMILNSQWIDEGKGAVEPVSAGYIAEPTKPATDQFEYKFSKWDLPFDNITGPLELYPVFEEILRDYPVYFYNDQQKLQEGRVYYGEYASYLGDTTQIYKMINGVPSDYYEFTGWSPSIDAPITGPMYFYAQFSFDGYIEEDWATIAANVAKGDLSNYGLAGRKTFTYTVDGLTSVVEAEIIGVNHDQLSTLDNSYNNGAATAGLTFAIRLLGKDSRIVNGNSQTDSQGHSSLNAGGWEKCELRTWCNTDLYAALPEDLRNAIKEVVKTSDTGYYTRSLITTVDKVWLLSDRELNAEDSNYVVAGQGEPYPLFTNNTSRIKANPETGKLIYWTRSTGTDGQHFFRYIDASGNPNSNGGGNQGGIAFAFCI